MILTNFVTHDIAVDALGRAGEFSREIDVLPILDLTGAGPPKLNQSSVRGFCYKAKEHLFSAKKVRCFFVHETN